MKKTVIALSVLLILTSMAVAIVAVGYHGADSEAYNEFEKAEREETVPVPDTVVYGINGDPQTQKTLYFSKTVEIAGRETYGYSESGSRDLYLYDKNGAFIGWISDPDVDPTLSESFEEILKDPQAGISKEEAVVTAYDHAAALYGAEIYDYELLSVSEDDYQVLVTLAKRFDAADFTVYGGKCSVRVLKDGTVDFCSGSEVGGLNESALRDLTSEDLESFVRAKIEEQFGDQVDRFEVWDKRLYENESGQTVIRIGVYCYFAETPSDEIIEKYGLGGSWGLDNCYGCTFEYNVG